MAGEAEAAAQLVALARLAADRDAVRRRDVPARERVVAGRRDLAARRRAARRRAAEPDLVERVGGRGQRRGVVAARRRLDRADLRRLRRAIRIRRRLGRLRLRGGFRAQPLDALLDRVGVLGRPAAVLVVVEVVLERVRGLGPLLEVLLVDPDVEQHVGVRREVVRALVLLNRLGPLRVLLGGLRAPEVLRSLRRRRLRVRDRAHDHHPGPHRDERTHQPSADASSSLPWHFLYFLPEPHGHGSLRPTLGRSRLHRLRRRRRRRRRAVRGLAPPPAARRGRFWPCAASASSSLLSATPCSISLALRLLDRRHRLLLALDLRRGTAC